MKASYFKKAEDVIHLFNPITRFLIKYNIFSAESCVTKCKECKQIPTEVISGYCWDCLPRHKENL
jgi:hypothetical protein